MALNWIRHNQRMKTVLTDTNIILWTFNGGPDFREAIDEVMPGATVGIPSCVISELKKLETKEARTALKFCKDMNIVDIGTGYADDMLFEAAQNGNIIAKSITVSSVAIRPDLVSDEKNS